MAQDKVIEVTMPMTWIKSLYTTVTVQAPINATRRQIMEMCEKKAEYDEWSDVLDVKSIQPQGEDFDCHIINKKTGDVVRKMTWSEIPTASSSRTRRDDGK